VVQLEHVLYGEGAEVDQWKSIFKTGYADYVEGVLEQFSKFDQLEDR
jgi:hypothetical protein